MSKDELQIFIVLTTLILLVFINGIIIFIFQYRKRKLTHVREKEVMNAQHTRELLSTRIEIQHQTMQDIGREIHDNVGQRLTLASIHANRLSYDNLYPQINEEVTVIGNLINESLAELRSLSRSLTNTNAHSIELRELIESECARVNSLKTCIVNCTFNETSFSISVICKNFIVRIIQEFVQNSLKHAGCKHIDLDFYYTEAGLKITASDDGSGFRVSNTIIEGKIIEGKGIGLANMKKRAELIGASFLLTGAINKGVQLVLFIPSDKLNAS